MTKLVIFLGPTGAGKSTQGDYLAAHYPGWVHLSSGDLLRRDPAIAARLASGSLARDDEVDRVVDAALVQYRDAAVIILDGFPRKLDQIPWLEEAIRRYNLELRAVIHFKVAKDLVAERLATRGRADDNAAATEVKWRWYDEQTRPLLNHYRDKGLVTDVDGSQPVEVVAGDIKEAVNV